MGAGEGEEDRLSCLPDDLLHSILGKLPLKHATRTSALSRRWARLWLHAIAASAVLDFTDRDFVSGQPPARIATTVNRCLRIHGDAAPIDALRLRVPFSPSGAFARDVVRWVATAVARGAREVEVDLTTQKGGVALELPGELFRAENSLARLGLCRFSLRGVPPGAAGLAGLTSLSLDHVDVTDEAVRGIVSGCRLLKFLSLRSCPLLASVKITSEKLRSLELVGCLAVGDLKVAAPALESFAFNSDVVDARDNDTVSSVGISGDGATATLALRDAHLAHVSFEDYSDVEHEFAYSTFLDRVAHARILTLCTLGWMQQHSEDTARHIYELRMYAPNLRELQVLMDSIDDHEALERFFSGLFVSTAPPFLERVFIRLPGEDRDPGDAGGVAAAVAGEDTDFGLDYVIGLDYDIVLDHLRFIKVVNFRGKGCELRLLRLLLSWAPVLEQLVLVTPEEEGTPGDRQRSDGLLLRIIQGQVSILPKASPAARIAVCRPREEGSRYPEHTRRSARQVQFVL